MLILTTPTEMQEWSRHAQRHKHNIGFVPTMGALHAGHTTLLQHCVESNSASVLSIFVNPTQFNVAEDFEKYPRTLEHDLQIAEQNNIDVVYAPTVDVMYPSGSSVVVVPGTAADRMEGEKRPGHFAGVTTIVSKLFHAVLPHRAYFGKKDFQQLAVIRQMVKDLDFPVEIVGIDTVRESDGLAMSSRNVRLSPENRAAATSISEGLFAARARHELGEHNSHELSKLVSSRISQHDSTNIEYVDVCNPVDLGPIADTSAGAVICVAAWFGDVRLIDNVELKPA
jgi:pantoate--beta-alanine ligase